MWMRNRIEKWCLINYQNFRKILVVNLVTFLRCFAEITDGWPERAVLFPFTTWQIKLNWNRYQNLSSDVYNKVVLLQIFSDTSNLLHACSYILMIKHIYIYTCINIHTDTDTHAHMYIYIYIHIYIYIYVY